MRLRLKSFTLVEVLVVSSLIAVLSIAIFRSFGNGLKLWGRAERLNKEAEIAIFLDKMAEDLRTVYVMSEMNFKGYRTKLSFPAIIMAQADAKSSRAEEGLVDQMGAVQYHFEPATHVVLRQQANYGQALKGKWFPQEIPVASGVDDLIFHYEVASDKSFLFKPEITEGIPSGVMVEVYFSDDSGAHQIKRYLPIPVGK